VSYQEEYRVGAPVKIAPLDHLQAFMRGWTLHHPLQVEQLQFAGTADRVRWVGFYHGGDVIYRWKTHPAHGTKNFYSRLMDATWTSSTNANLDSAISRDSRFVLAGHP
jgi:hypothetical protein